MSLEYYKEKQDSLKQNFIKQFSNCLYQERKERNYLDIVFLCIGTDKIIGDCLGPLVGTKLEELLDNYNIYNINIYGTLDKNICYTNVNDILEKIKLKHKNCFIIVIDAALSKEENIGKIYTTKEAMVLGKGLNKTKIQVGDISIKVVVGKDYKLPTNNFSCLQNISLNEVMKLSNIVAEGIYEVIKYI